MARNEKLEEDDDAVSVRLCRACLWVRACADERALPQLVPEPGLRTGRLFVLKCFIKWKEVCEEVPSLLLSHLGMVSEGMMWFEEERVICLKVLPN